MSADTNSKISHSRFWKSLWQHYQRAPSIALCRVPELEYASTLSLTGRTLDHCCGDGLFASMGWPGQKFSAGCDVNSVSIADAKRLARHEDLQVVDVAKRLPYDDAYFDLVFDNSALEHVLDLDTNLKEVSRVLKPGGKFGFNVLNKRYFDWWPLDRESMEGYRKWQPFHHALTLSEWNDRLVSAGLEIVEVQGYFDQEASRELARLDCEFSGYFIRKRPSELVDKYNSLMWFQRRKWRDRLGALNWKTEADEGAGFFFVTRRR